jgi:hypothetical protein
MNGIARWFDAHKPVASRRTQLMCAALMWSIVGALMLTCGAWWALGAAGASALIVIPIAVAIGLLKARFVLRGSAHRIIRRILRHGDGKCLGGFLSWRFWIVVALMASTGRLLRMTAIPLSVVGALYTVVGVALVSASRSLWRAWMAIA